MPLYDYRCKKCGHEDSEYQSIHDEALTECPKCKGEYEKKFVLPHTTQREFKKPIEMHSIAMNTLDEIIEFKRKAPDVDVAVDPSDPLFGVPVAKSRHAKLQALNAAGYEERN